MSANPSDVNCESLIGTTLAAGATKTCFFDATFANANQAQVINTVTVTATNNAGTSTKTDTSTVNFPGKVDLTKTADAASVSAGEQIGFTLTVKNTGAGAANGVTLTDTLPANTGLSWSESPDNTECSITAGVLNCNFGTIAAGATKSVHVVSLTTKDSCGTINNTGNVTSTDSGSDSGSASTDVKCAVIDVAKTADAPFVNAGEQIGFTVTLSNSGTGQAKGIQFTDALPAGFTWSISPASTGWSIVNGSLVYSPTTLDGGATTSVHVIASTTKDNCGTVPNTASVSTSNDGSDSATASTDVRCAAIDITKTADAPSVSAGDQIGFTVTLSNTGTGQAKGVAVTDPLPGGLTWSIDPANADWEISGGSLVYKHDTLAAGASSTVHVVATTTQADCGDVTNTASVTTSNDGSDEATAKVDVLCAAINITKTADAPSVSAGDQIGFTVKLENNGAGEAKGVVVSDTLPAGLTWTIDPANADWEITGGNLVYKHSTLAAGGSSTVHVIATTTKANCGDVDNTATVTTTNTGSDESSASVDVNCADIDVDKTADAASVSAGEQIGFTVKLTDHGEGEAKGIQFTDVLPAGLNWSIDPANADWEITGGNLVYKHSTLAAGGELDGPRDRDDDEGKLRRGRQHRVGDHEQRRLGRVLGVRGRPVRGDRHRQGRRLRERQRG